MSRLTKICLILAVIGGSAWLQYLIDDGMGISWPQNVMRNWEQFGFFNLHGRLVANPGGFEAVAKPEIYKGMSPVYLYPVYFATEIFSWTGLGTMSFHILLALAVFWAVWNLLGRDDFAFAVAAVAVLCPGYARWQKILDPNVITVLFGLPYIAIVIAILKKTRLGLVPVIGLFGLTLVFTSLNWTSAWAFGPCALLLLGLPQINRRAVFLFIVLAGASSVLFAIGSVVAKSGGGRAGMGNASLVQFIRSYTWGDTGYGAGLTTGKALLRLSFVNGIGLLPLLVISVCVAAKKFQRGNLKFWFALSPFVLTVAEVGFMRNYFGHHPWMAAPVLLMGLVFALVLLRVNHESTVAAPNWEVKKFLVPTVVLLCFIYGLAVEIFLRANEVNTLSLVNFIRHQTNRSDCIVIVKNVDPQTARLASRFEDVLDRRVMVADDLDHLPVGKDRIIILSAVPSGSALTLLAQTSGGGASSQSWLHQTTDWFNRSIARRRPGDRLELADTYFLYETKP
jgi:hypothetical protein